ncbi:hypothetical protein HBB16_07640 [Pseudonocardia sp. MCCB 268]|nr:hypothetical protein [Pseudonocardia cytotoxica]
MAGVLVFVVNSMARATFSAGVVLAVAGLVLMTGLSYRRRRHPHDDHRDGDHGGLHGHVRDEPGRVDAADVDVPQTPRRDRHLECVVLRRAGCRDRRRGLATPAPRDGTAGSDQGPLGEALMARRC